MPKLSVRVTVTQSDDDGGNRVEKYREEQRTVARRYIEEDICTALMDHLDDELKWQDENVE